MLIRYMHIDFETARRHIAALEGPETPHIFVCVPEARGAKGRVQHVYGPLEAVRGRLETEQRAGCGIFVTVNAMAGRRRLKVDVTRVRALWIERDGPGPDLPLAPSLVVETSPGKRHEYLLTVPEDPIDAEQATRLNRTMAEIYGGDRQATDAARALRLAGSWHIKGEPHLVRILVYPDARYSARALKSAFPEPKNEPRAPNLCLPIARRERYRAAATEGVCAELAEAAEGARNDTLNRSAFRLGRLGLELGEIVAILTPVALGIGLSQGETAATIRSGALAGGQLFERGVRG